jgi:SAM-dependent methyltransferase
MSVKSHYDTHLSFFYEWMAGSFSELVAFHEKLFIEYGFNTQNSALAVDLGAGHGIHSVALANLGWQVVAIDFNERLLKSLEQHQRSNIKLVYDNLLHFKNHVGRCDLALCMGDTLSHLESPDELTELLKRIHHSLHPNGRFLISIRDYSNELTGNSRFIPVKADEDRILTCVLEYTDEKVTVTDLLYEKQDGNWVQKVGSYQKLRLSRELMRKYLTDEGFQIISEELHRGLYYVLSSKL